MNLLAALEVNCTRAIHVVLDRVNVAHQHDVVGRVLVLAELENVGDTSFKGMRFEYNVEANSDLNAERFTLLGDVDVNLYEYTDLDELKRRITFLVQFDLIGQAIALELASAELTDAYNTWNYGEELFEFECSEGFNIVDIANETAKSLCKSVEEFFELKQAA